MDAAAPDFAARRRSWSQDTENGRRKKRAPRIRVTRACDRCKRKKIRCTGLQPCAICLRADAPCTYDATYSRGRRQQQPTITVGCGSLDGRSPVGEGSRVVHEALPGAHHRIQDDEDDVDMGGEDVNDGRNLPAPILSSRQHSDGGDDAGLAPPEGPPNRLLSTTAVPQPVPSSRTSPEPTQTDRQGHYVGPASGVSFLLRVQKRLHQTLAFSKTSSIFTFGDAPLPDVDLSFFVLPPRDEAQRLLDRYFDFAVPTHRFLHRPTVQGWLDELYETMGMLRDEDGAAARIAVLFMVFAQAREYLPSAPGPVSDVSSRYFLMADHQLAKERGAVRLTSIQARLCQCFYLLSMSRINHCWTLFGTTAHLAFAIGLNRNRRADPAAGLDPVDVECRRRVFWCLYSLDNYLSAALGRPRTFHDADIDAELPSVVDDAELSSTTTSAASAAATFATTTTTNITNTTTTTTHLPLSMSTTTTLPISTTTATPRRAASSRVMLAAVAHVRLSRIVSVILRDLYPIRPLSTSARAALTEKCARDLRSWHADMAQFLDPHGVSAALLLPIYQRQRNVLNLSYWHAVILTHRPFLLSNFARLQQSGGGGGGGGSQERHRSRRQQQQQQHQQHSRQPETSVRECLQAAMHIVDTVDELVQTSQMFRAFWFTSYFAFCAVVVLYVYVIQESSSPAAAYQVYLDAATKCQYHLAGLAEKESLAQRYCLVLEELRLEAVRHLEASPKPAVPTAHPTPYARPDLPDVGGVGGGGGAEMLQDDALDQFRLVDDGSAGFNASPSSFLADMTSWGNFDSMVTSGLAHLDGLIGGGESYGF